MNKKIFVQHILVQHKYEAEDIQRKLKQGINFSDLAKKYSLCSSSSVGGHLGDVSKKIHLLDENFVEELIKLKPGVISNPVKTKFGYHLLLINPQSGQ